MPDFQAKLRHDVEEVMRWLGFRPMTDEEIREIYVFYLIYGIVSMFFANEQVTNEELLITYLQGLSGRVYDLAVRSMATNIKNGGRYRILLSRPSWPDTMEEIERMVDNLFQEDKEQGLLLLRRNRINRIR